MAILINSDTNIVLQGSCTRKGFQLMDHMLDYNSNIVAGVCYLSQKGSDYRSVPIFSDLNHAMRDFPSINTAIIVSGAYQVLENCLEALENGIQLIVISTEFVPLKDIILIESQVSRYQAVVIGPNSTGIINPDVVLVGSMGGVHSLSVFKKGKIGVISRSNGLINEVSSVLKKAGLGISTAVSLGTEKILMYSFVDVYKHFEMDSQTDAVVIIGGPGWHGEEEFASYYTTLTNPKPVIAFLAGHFIDDLPSGFFFGHLSAIKGEGTLSVGYKRKMLADAGIRIARFLQDIPQLLISFYGQY
jgi:succinyl-CoA synthetase alpha subunit